MSAPIIPSTSQISRHPNWRLRRRHWFVLDLFLSAAAILLAYAFQPQFVFGWATSNIRQPGAFQAALTFPWIVVMCMHAAGLQDPLGDRRSWLALLRTMLSVLAALGIYLLVLYAISLNHVGRSILARTFVLDVCFLAGARIFLWRWAAESRTRIGCYLAPKSLARFKDLIELNHVLIIATPPGSEEEPVAGGAVADFFVRRQIDEIVVAASESHSSVWLACLNRGIQVTDVTVFVEREYYKVPCDELDMAWFLRIDLKWSHSFFYRFKRMADLLIAALGLLLTLPLIAVAAVATLLESGAPVFYSQTRVGFRGKHYRLLKLRTMRVDAESNGPEWARMNDRRVTRVGSILRRTRIDETPQFWNVIKGEMALVGPRPERPEFVKKLESVIPMYSQRHWIKPGITGWAQINYQYGASIADAREKLCYDLYYLKNASPLLDTHIALRTIGALMKGSR